MTDERSISFRGRVRYWDVARGSGLAVVDVPTDLVEALGGRHQYRVVGTIEGHAFTGSGMLAGGGGYCVGLSRAALTAAGVAIGDEVEVRLSRA